MIPDPRSLPLHDASDADVRHRTTRILGLRGHPAGRRAASPSPLCRGVHGVAVVPSRLRSLSLLLWRLSPSPKSFARYVCAQGSVALRSLSISIWPDPFHG